ncbi:MAG TPA: hypothetical protein VK911_10560, partial [Vicinamibacterales bacterium]|nr:hypothetical protein [Vicinamibacterales bacterium]
MDGVTAVLIERGREAPSMRPMVGFSIGLHVIALLVLFFQPDPFLKEEDPSSRSVMTIDIGGGEGPSAGGANALAARPIQVAVPLPEV